MKNSNITISTRVHHPDGGTYRLHAVGGSGDDITTLNIIKEGFGHCFLGSPDQAREQGFLLGDEGLPGGLPHGTIITHSAYPDRTYGYQCESSGASNGTVVYRIMRDGAAVTTGTVAELTASGFQFNSPEVVDIESLLEPEPETWEQKDARIAELEATTSDLLDKVGTLTTTTATQEQNLATLRAKLRAAENALSEFKTQVRDAVLEARTTHDFCKEGTNTFLTDLGLDPIAKTFAVTVTRDSDGEVVLVVTGVEADDDDGATDKVKENFSVTATVSTVTFDYEYDGEGDTDWEHTDFTDDDYGTEDSDCADNHKDNLTFSAEEE